MEANQKIRNAQKERFRLLAQARSNLDKFYSVAGQYKKDPEIVKRRIYSEAMEEVFYFLGKHYVVPSDYNRNQNYRIELVEEQ